MLTAIPDQLSLRFFGSVAGAPVALSPYGPDRTPATGQVSIDDLLHAAAEIDQTIVDCSGAEERVGTVLGRRRAMRHRLALLIRNHRSRDSRSKTLIESCDQSLARLGADTVDLYLVDGYDHFTDPADLAATLTRLRSSGRVREIGVAGYTASQFRTLAEYVPFQLVTNQLVFGVDRLAPMTDGSLDLALETGTTPLVAAGAATVVGIAGPEGEALLDQLAEVHAVDRAVIALAFVLAHPSRPVVLAETADLAHFEMLRTATSLALSHDECHALLGAVERSRS